jgi:hypothetical protein
MAYSPISRMNRVIQPKVNVTIVQGEIPNWLSLCILGTDRTEDTASNNYVFAVFTSSQSKSGSKNGECRPTPSNRST